MRLTQHPMLTVLAIWSLAHIIPNGNLAHLILFGCFGLFALVGKRIIDRRKNRERGVESEKIRHHVSSASVWNITGGLGVSLIVRFLLAISAYLAIIWLHPIFIGVDPLAGG